MPEKYVYKELCNRIKSIFIKRREELNLFREDVAEMTGFNRNTIALIEQTGNPTVSQYFEICVALKLDPRELFSGTLRKGPRNKLSTHRKESTKLTMRINELLETSFFEEPKTAKDVLMELRDRFPDSRKIETKNISVILKRFVHAKKLVVKPETGRINSYKRK